jgi:general nucleoside transport system ATP-binding protein
VEGNGQRELVDALLGLAPVRGSIRLQGTELIGLSTHGRRHRGLAVIPADRNTDGVCRSASIAENLVATCFGDPPYARVGVLRPAAIAAHAREVIARFRVRDASPRQPIGSLSGGNMQRLVVAREVQSAPAVLVATYPTRGVDVRAARFIRSLLLDLRAQGRSVILISEDLSEIVEICDRLIVLFEGRVVGECPVEEADPRRLGRLMMGEDVGENTASAGNVAWRS